MKDKTSISDILNYQVDKYFTPDEEKFIQSTFGTPQCIKILRKVFLPSIADLELPLEEAGNDAWLSGRDWASIPDAEVKSIAVGRQEAIKYIIGGLIKLKMIAFNKPLSPTEEALREMQNSTK